MSLEVKALFSKGEDFSTHSVPSLEFDLEGIVDVQKYRGHTRTTDARERTYIDKSIVRGEEVLNWRQVTAVAVNEMQIINGCNEVSYKCQ